MKKIIMVAAVAMLGICAFAKTYKTFYTSEEKGSLGAARDDAFEKAINFANEKEEEGYNTRVYFADNNDTIIVVEYEKSITTTAKEATGSLVEKGKSFLGK